MEGAAGYVLKPYRTGTPPSNTSTDQERHIFDLIGEGLANRQIGERLFLTEKTVKNYSSSTFAKLGMSRRARRPAQSRLGSHWKRRECGVEVASTGEPNGAPGLDSSFGGG